ncbi:YibE/F family protein [Brevibacterium siliguriense]|nr:YibE/F family protein [Brevibacterium siliguriense]
MTSQHEPKASPKVQLIMLACLVPLIVVTIAGLFVLWPSGPDKELPGGGPTTNTAEGTTDTKVTVTAVDASDCESGKTDPMVRADCTKYIVEADGQEGSLYVTPDAVKAGVDVGDRIKALDFTQSPDRAEMGTDYVFIDFDRNVPMLALAIIYAIVVLLVAGLRGLRALIGLGFAGAVLFVFMLPAMLDGKPPVLVAMVSASLIMVIALYLAHGISTRTSTALFGTVLGIIITGILGAWMTSWANLGIAYSEDGYLLVDTTDLGMTDMIVCAILITGLGVLNDVTITQASAVWELAAAAPEMKPGQLFSRAMRIGRDHIASTVYTITFAYVGSALMTLIIVSAHDQPLFDTFTLGDMSVEVVSILVCSIGLVIAIPLTTGLGVLVVRSGLRPPRRPVASAASPVPAVSGGETTERATAEAAGAADGHPEPAREVPGSPAGSKDPVGPAGERPPMTRREARERDRNR